MNEILSIALQGMQYDMARLDRIAMNLVNANTGAYKREIVTVRPFAHWVDGRDGVAPPDPDARVTRGNFHVHSDSRPGTLKSTGQSLDIALGGDGYFEVATADGPAYTRQGNFRLDASGRLVTAQGLAVMGKGGEIYLKQSSPFIDGNGRIFDTPAQGGAGGQPLASQPVAQFRIVRFSAPDVFERVGDGLVTTSANPEAMTDDDVQVRQGCLENSNVSSMHEMVQMIQVMRHFESMQRVAAGHDDMLATAIRKLGEPA